MPNKLTQDALDAIQTRLEKATPGPWAIAAEKQYTELVEYDGAIVRGADSAWVCDCGSINHPSVMDDAEFIAHAPADIADLLAHAEALERENAELDKRACAFENAMGSIAMDADAELRQLRDENAALWGVAEAAREMLAYIRYREGPQKLDVVPYWEAGMLVAALAALDAEARDVTTQQAAIRYAGKLPPLEQDSDDLSKEGKEMNNGADRRIVVSCLVCGDVELTDAEYMHQLSQANALWYCPRCFQSAMWRGIWHRCLDQACNGWASEDEDTCDVCGRSQYELFLENEP